MRVACTTAVKRITCPTHKTVSEILISDISPKSELEEFVVSPIAGSETEKEVISNTKIKFDFKNFQFRH